MTLFAATEKGEAIYTRRVFSVLQLAWPHLVKQGHVTTWNVMAFPLTPGSWIFRLFRPTFLDNPRKLTHV
jgi:hypothetical protein